MIRDHQAIASGTLHALPASCSATARKFVKAACVDPSLHPCPFPRGLLNRPNVAFAQACAATQRVNFARAANGEAAFAQSVSQCHVRPHPRMTCP